MQIVGTAALEDGVNSVANRSGRKVVIDWAIRVLKRHVRRDPSLVKEVGPKDESKFLAAMKLDNLSDEVQSRILKEWRSGQAKVYLPSQRAIAAFFQRAADTMDWIESLPDGDRRIRRIDRMSWTDADEASRAWHHALAKAKVDTNNRLKGLVKVHDYDDGSFMAKLTTQAALKSEGAMMGHCVGGYWDAVSKGQTQIYSLRDRDGFPHATIEMKHTPEVVLDDGSVVRVGAQPRPGVNCLYTTESNWVAVQVRGKQNRRPLDKYVDQIVDWFSEHDIQWVEYGEEMLDPQIDRQIVFFNIGGPTGKNFADPEVAHEMACEELMRLAAKPTVNSHFANNYRSIGLQALHYHFSDPVMVQKFINKVSASVIEGFESMIEKQAFAVSVERSGISVLMRLADKFGLSITDIKRHVFDAVCQREGAAPDPVFHKEQLLTAKGIGDGVDVVVHQLALAPLSLLANGFAEGVEGTVLDRIKPYLSQSVEVMNRFPDRIHVIQSNYKGVTPDNIRQAFLFCGLGNDYFRAQTKVAQGLKSKVSAIRLGIKRAKPSGELTAEGINLLRNMLNDGYEARINNAAATKFGSNSFVVAFEDVKPQPAPRLSADPVVRSTRYPAMRL